MDSEHAAQISAPVSKPQKGRRLLHSRRKIETFETMNQTLPSDLK